MIAKVKSTIVEILTTTYRLLVASTSFESRHDGYECCITVENARSCPLVFELMY